MTECRAACPAVVLLLSAPPPRISAGFTVACLAEVRVHRSDDHSVRALPRPALRSLSDEDPKMPKMKTKSSVKRRFKRTGTGKILMNVAYKRHMLSNKSTKMKRQARGTKVMSVADQSIVRKFMPYDR